MSTTQAVFHYIGILTVSFLFGCGVGSILKVIYIFFIK